MSKLFTYEEKIRKKMYHTNKGWYVGQNGTLEPIPDRASKSASKGARYALVGLGTILGAGTAINASADQVVKQQVLANTTLAEANQVTVANSNTESVSESNIDSQSTTESHTQSMSSTQTASVSEEFSQSITSQSSESTSESVTSVSENHSESLSDDTTERATTTTFRVADFANNSAQNINLNANLMAVNTDTQNQNVDPLEITNATVTSQRLSNGQYQIHIEFPDAVPLTAGQYLKFTSQNYISDYYGIFADGAMTDKGSGKLVYRLSVEGSSEDFKNPKSLLQYFGVGSNNNKLNFDDTQLVQKIKNGDIQDLTIDDYKEYLKIFPDYMPSLTYKITLGDYFENLSKNRHLDLLTGIINQNTIDNYSVDFLGSSNQNTKNVNLEVNSNSIPGSIKFTKQGRDEVDAFVKDLNSKFTKRPISLTVNGNSSNLITGGETGQVQLYPDLHYHLDNSITNSQLSVYESTMGTSGDQVKPIGLNTDVVSYYTRSPFYYVRYTPNGFAYTRDGFEREAGQVQIQVKLSDDTKAHFDKSIDGLLIDATDKNTPDLFANGEESPDGTFIKAIDDDMSKYVSTKTRYQVSLSDDGKTLTFTNIDPIKLLPGTESATHVLASEKVAKAITFEEGWQSTIDKNGNLPLKTQTTVIDKQANTENTITGYRQYLTPVFAVATGDANGTNVGTIKFTPEFDNPLGGQTLQNILDTYQPVTVVDNGNWKSTWAYTIPEIPGYRATMVSVNGKETTLPEGGKFADYVGRGERDYVVKYVNIAEEDKSLSQSTSTVLSQNIADSISISTSNSSAYESFVAMSKSNSTSASTAIKESQSNSVSLSTVQA
ncbi:hypothetical protein, partial [Ligilactobacillus equi]|uniref:hypothetical protein n=1 Tax=Ligilactobacillus equi TaxID=137357 RepID=UPI0005505F80